MLIISHLRLCVAVLIVGHLATKMKCCLGCREFNSDVLNTKTCCDLSHWTPQKVGTQKLCRTEFRSLEASLVPIMAKLCDLISSWTSCVNIKW